MSDLETRIEGSPGGIRASGRWLVDTFAARSDELATSTLRARADAVSTWSGEAGTAFGERAKALARSGDDAHDAGVGVEREVETLAVALNTAQNDMAQVRETARGAGLSVSGTVVRDPGPRLRITSPEPGPDATPSEVASYADAKKTVQLRALEVDAFDKACKAAEKAYERWQDAVQDFSATWKKWDSELVGLSADFLTGGASAALVLKVAPILMKHSEFLLDSAARLRAHTAAMTSPTGTVLDAKHFYRLLKEANAAEVSAAKVAAEAKNFKIPKGIGRGLGILGVLATGYAINEDLESGESVPQAVTSNTGSLVAGIAAGAAAGAPIGALVGTFIPIPGVGTAAGLIVGTVVGSVAGAFTSGAIDSLFENGITNAGAAWDAGMDEIGDLGSAVGDLASDAWGAIFG